MGIREPPFWGCPSVLLFKFTLSLATKGWRGHPGQAELCPPSPERQGGGEGSGVAALAAGLGTCLRGGAHPGYTYGQAGAGAATPAAGGASCA